MTLHGTKITTYSGQKLHPGDLEFWLPLLSKIWPSLANFSYHSCKPLGQQGHFIRKHTLKSRPQAVRISDAAPELDYSCAGERPCCIWQKAWLCLCPLLPPTAHLKVRCNCVVRHATPISQVPRNLRYHPRQGTPWSEASSPHPLMSDYCSSSRLRRGENSLLDIRVSCTISVLSPRCSCHSRSIFFLHKLSPQHTPCWAS